MLCINILLLLHMVLDTCEHRKVTAAAEQQLKRLWHTTNIYVCPPLHEYCEKLASYLPDPLKVGGG